jgi:hypothetical protein
MEKKKERINKDKKIGHNLKMLIKTIHEKSRKTPKKGKWLEQENA